MNIQYTILGAIMIVVGVLIAITQIKRFESGEKDQAGYVGRLLIKGIGFIMLGIILIVKYI